MPAAPAASCALGSGRSARVTTSTPESPGIPARNGFNGVCRALPGDRALLPPSSCEYGMSAPGRAVMPPQNLTPASGRQNHTIWPSLAASLVRVLKASLTDSKNPPCDPSRARRCRVHPHPAPNVRDDRDTPLSRAGMASVIKMIWGQWEAEYFCGGGLDW